MRGATAVVIFTERHAIKIHTIDGFLEHETNINNLLHNSSIKKDNLLLMTRTTYKGSDCLIGRKAMCSANSMVGSYDLAGKLLEDVCKALGEMHSIGVCHRDISLSNILYDGTKFMLCDFGQSTQDPSNIPQDYRSLLRCLEIFLRTNEVRRSHFTSINYWRLYNDCRNKISIKSDGST